MKRILLTIIISFAFIVPCYAVNGVDEEESLSDLIKAKNDKTKPESELCPETRMKNQCMTCHSYPDMSLKEKATDANRLLPADTEIKDEGKTAYLYITAIDSFYVEKFFKYVSWHPEITKCVFEIHSPGGSLFEGWRIVGLMELWKAKGMIIETRCHGFAASAGFVLFVNGSQGHRFASATSELMWHELYTFSVFKVSRPSASMDEAIVLRHLQDTASNYLADRSNMSAEEWDAKVHKKEFWCNGAEAVKYGLSDGEPK